MSTTQLSNFRGIHTRKPRHALTKRLPTHTEHYVADAVNVDVNNAGDFEHRLEPILAVPLPGAHSLVMLTEGVALVVCEGEMLRVTLDGGDVSTVTALSSDAPLSWAWLAGELYWSNGEEIGRIERDATGAVVSVPVALPVAPTPVASATSGDLLAGMYRVAVAYVDARGDEGPLSPALELILADDSGVIVSSPPDADHATGWNAYLTSADGEALYLAASEALGTDAAIHAPATGRAARGRPERPLPPGRLFVSNGGLGSYSGRDVFLGAPWRPGYRDALTGHLPFPAEVSIVVDAQDGLYIVSDVTRWMPHGETPVLQDVLPYGAVPGTAFTLPGDPRVGWFGREGFVLASPGGKVEAPMSEHVEPFARSPMPGEGFATLIDEGGFTRVVACAWVMNLTEPWAATRYEGWALTSWDRSFGTTPEGICRLGRSEHAAPWRVDFGLRNFEHAQEARLVSVYAGGRALDRFLLALAASGEFDAPRVYPAQSVREALDQVRFVPGKGLRANWYRITLFGDEGCDFRLNSLTVVSAPTARKI
jgi:hypothetical protein